MFRRILLGTVAMSLITTTASAQEDPYLWLEDVMGDKAIAYWKRSHNSCRFVTRF
jgi:hypothetical protein